MQKLDLSKYKNSLSRSNQIKRLCWRIIWIIFAKPFPRSTANTWKLFLLRIFGAKVHKTAVVYSSVTIYMPWHLEMHENSCLAADVDCYNVDDVILKANTIVSQKVYLCTASHNINSNKFPLITAPIILEDQSWIGASAFIGMGVTVNQGAIVGATASVYKDVPSWTVVGGNPAKFLKNRNIVIYD